MAATEEQPPAGLLTHDFALFLDFDGTLTELADDPDSVYLPDGGEDVLTELALRLDGAMALVSGRDGRDLAKRTPGGIWRAGNHGDMILSPGSKDPKRLETPPDVLTEAAETFCDAHDGVRVEHKARVLAIHTRLAAIGPDLVAAKLAPVVEETGGYKLQIGKDIVELKPEGIHKGRAIEVLLEEPVFAGKMPLFIGDDTTDEDGFEVCMARGGTCIKVGDGPTLAPYRLSDPKAVWRFLKEARDALA